MTLNLSDSQDWRFTNAAALTAALNARFSMKLSYNVAHLNTPPPGKKQTDTTAAAALVAKF
jgi:putative salt-induced outer membrane protein YdiY